MKRLALACLLPALLSVGCHTPDPKQEFEMLGLETYWVVGSPRAGTNYLAPAVRFRLRHKGQEGHHSVEATAAFRRKGEEETWGSAWERVVAPGEVFEPGQTRLVLLTSDASYTSKDPPEVMLQNDAFVDANVTVFVRVGSSQWVQFAKVDIARRIGAKEVESEAPQ